MGREERSLAPNIKTSGQVEELGELAIEEMREGDLPEVFAIERASFPTPWSEKMFRQELKDRDISHLLTVKLAGRVIGYGGFWKVMNEAHIATLTVHPDLRRKGIGKKLLSTLLDLGESLGATIATLEVREGNVAAQELYRKFGFKIVAIQKSYYSDTGENALVMLLNMAERIP